MKNKIKKIITIIIFLIVIIIFFPQIIFYSMMFINGIWTSIGKGKFLETYHFVDKNYDITTYRTSTDDLKIYYKYHDGTEKYITTSYFNRNGTRIERIDFQYLGIIRVGFNNNFVDTLFIKLE